MASERYGAQILGKVEGTRETLEDFLKSVQLHLTPHPSRTGIPLLDEIWRNHPEQKRLSIKGRGMVLLYHIIDRMVGNGGTVAVVDITGRFSPSHLMCSRDDLKHIHVFLANKHNFQTTLSSIKGYMEYGDHGSKHRPWTSTLVFGENGGDICVVWNGWLTVEKEEVVRYLPGVDAEEAVGGRGQRRKVVDGKGWKAVSERGEEYRWDGRED